MVAYSVERTTAFRRDVERARRQGLDMEKLSLVVTVLSSGGRLPASCRDHALRGEWKGNRECHVGPDWLLVYRKIDEKLVLLLVRTGTHRGLGLGG